MTGIISLLIIITLSLLSTRIGAIALMHTGLSKEIAVFQARSAFMGVGFTTRESESVINRPRAQKDCYAADVSWECRNHHNHFFGGVQLYFHWQGRTFFF